MSTGCSSTGSLGVASMMAEIDSGAIELAKERKLVKDEGPHPDAHALVASEGEKE